uniref:Glycerol kinase n=1 Tax=uncultured delta proteobacterium HF0010_08B07 TaxID=710821 RepID=E0XWV4_9DELT|nr:glycerol kinase [uncultured delta proteobacterium HF0010_08B07]
MTSNTTPQYVLAIDQGTTGSTALIINEDMQVLGRANYEFTQHFPQLGWVEHDLSELMDSVHKAIEGAISKAAIDPSQIQAIGITNQRETIALWDRKSHQALHRAIVWQCRRTSDYCQSLKVAGHEERVRELTGLCLDPYFSGTKMKWLLDEIENCRDRAVAGELAFGTMDSYLLWQLTGGQVHATDISNASRTLLMDLKSGEWSDELLELFTIPRATLPDIRSNSEIYGTTQGFASLPDGIPIAGMAGDQQAALFGQACFNKGEAKCTYGTGAFLLMNTGDEPIYSRHGLLSTVAWKLGDETSYALEGSAFIAGAAVQWLRDGLGLIKSAPEIEDLALSVEDNGGVYFVPALTGLGAPHWNAEARGLICGLTRGSNKGHIARAALEGIAHQNDDILTAMTADSGAKLLALKVDGGASANALLMQTQADLLGCEIIRPTMLETTALGSGIMAGLAVGIWTDLSEVTERWSVDARFNRQVSESDVEQRRQAWRGAVNKTAI